MGRRLARLLSAFETRILAVDMFPVDKPDWVESLWPAQRLDELLPLVDFLVLSVPLNPTTRGMIDAAAMQKMKPGAVLVNVARGPLVVESDLVAALGKRAFGRRRDGRYRAGAAAGRRANSGTFPKSSSRRTSAARRAWRNDKITDLFCRNLVRWKQGQPLINFLADKRLGFPIRGGGYPLWGEAGVDRNVRKKIDRNVDSRNDSPVGLYVSLPRRRWLICADRIRQTWDELYDWPVG